jgi:hypothetical protein
MTHPHRSSRKSVTAWSRILLEKLTVGQFVKNFPVFDETYGSITVFTKARYWILF